MTATAAVREPNAMQPLPARQTRIPQLDGLRGLAILLVILFHYGVAVSIPGSQLFFHLQDCFRMGSYGVDLFFVLSGFLIGGILLDCQSSPTYFRTFYLRRFHRIFPLYYVWLGLYVVLALSAFHHLPTSIQMTWSGWRPVLVYALFAQNMVSKSLQGISGAWLGPPWSLAVEEQFYLLMPLAVRFLPKRRLVQLLVATTVLSPVLRVAFSKWTHAAQYTATPLRADALAMGVLLALALREEGWAERIKQNLKWLYATIGALSVGVLGLVAWPKAPIGYPDHVWALTCMELFFAAIILLALMQPYGWWAHFCDLIALRKLGGISYCVYVIHFAVSTICQAILHSLYGQRAAGVDFVSLVVASGITLALAKISWVYLESPMIRSGHAYRYYPEQFIKQQSGQHPRETSLSV